MTNFDKSTCDQIQKQLDSDPSPEAPSSTREDIAKHLAACPRCSEVFESHRRAKELLKGAVHRQVTPAHLEAKIRRRLRESERRGFPVWLWAPAAGLAAAMLLLFWNGPLGWQGQSDPWDMDRAAQEQYIESLSARVVAIMRVGLGDHLHCAHFRKFPQDAPSSEEMAAEMGPAYAALIPAMREAVTGGHHMVMGHQCEYRGREFVHMVVQGDNRLLSLVVARKEPGESLTSPDLAALRNAAGIPIYGATAHGVLFRGNAEAEIRRNLVRKGYIKGIIGLPANLFYGTGIPACIVVIDKEEAQARKGIFMIDASSGFMKDGPKNRLGSMDIHKIVDIFNKRLDVPKYARMVPFAEIEQNDFNLNLPRYIDSQMFAGKWKREPPSAAQ